MYMQFAFVYWSPDESALGFLGCGTDTVKFAYDLKRANIVTIASVAGDMRKGIFNTYGRVRGDDSLDPT
jgi:hypothetical protein